MECLENGQIGQNVPLSVMEDFTPGLENVTIQLQLTEVQTVMEQLPKLSYVTSKLVQVKFVLSTSCRLNCR